MNLFGGVQGAASPLGTVSDFFGANSDIPDGWILQPVSTTLANIVDYADLFAAVGIRYGGDGITTFGLPTNETLGNMQPLIHSSYVPGEAGDQNYCDVLNSTTLDIVQVTSTIIRTLRWDGSGLTQVGNTLTHGLSMSGSSISVMSSTRLAILEKNGTTSIDVQAYAWDGTDWTTEGSAFTAVSGNIARVSAAAMDDTHVAWADSTNYTTKMLEFNGSTWADITVTPLSGFAPNTTIIPLNATQIIHYTSSGAAVKLVEYNFTTNAFSSISVGNAEAFNSTGTIMLGGRVDSNTFVWNIYDKNIIQFSRFDDEFNYFENIGNPYNLIRQTTSSSCITSLKVNDGEIVVFVAQANSTDAGIKVYSAQQKKIIKIS